MTETGRPWADGKTDGGPYSANDWGEIIETLGRSLGANVGVVPDMENELAVTSSGNNNATVNTGRAITGAKRVYKNDASESKTTSSPSVGTTGRRVVVRDDWSAGTSRIAIISSDDGTASLPALTQQWGVTWENPLASFTITTGGVIAALTDEREFLPLPRWVRKAADEIVNNSAALQDDDELTMLFPANSTWDLEWMLRATSATATPDLKVGFTVPASAAGGVAIMGGDAAVVRGGAFGATFSTIPLWASADEAGVFIKATIRIGATSGAVTLRWAQQTATAEDTKILANSWMKATQVK